MFCRISTHSLAFLVKADRRSTLRWVWPGVAAAVLLSVTVGAILTYTTAHLTSARHISAELRGKMENALKLGPAAIVLVSFLSVGREGLETSVFFYASVQTARGETAVPLPGFVFGILTSVALTWLLYRGALRFDLGKFFKITGVLPVLWPLACLATACTTCRRAASFPVCPLWPSTLPACSRRPRGTARCSRASSTTPSRPPHSRQPPGCFTS